MLRILVVDDEPMIAMLAAEFIADLGHAPVGPAHSLDEALEMVKTHDIDGAIIDVLLGRQTAYPLAELLAARGIPFVFATGQSAAAIEPGHSAIAVLVKPFSANLFEAAIRAIASKHAHHATPQDGSGPYDPP